MFYAPKSTVILTAAGETPAALEIRWRAASTSALTLPGSEVSPRPAGCVASPSKRYLLHFAAKSLAFAGPPRSNHKFHVVLPPFVFGFVPNHSRSEEHTSE